MKEFEELPSQLKENCIYPDYFTKIYQLSKLGFLSGILNNHILHIIYGILKNKAKKFHIPSEIAFLIAIAWLDCLSSSLLQFMIVTFQHCYSSRLLPFTISNQFIIASFQHCDDSTFQAFNIYTV